MKRRRWGRMRVDEKEEGGEEREKSGKACRDIALNTHYLVLFNNTIDRQEVASLARIIFHPSVMHL